VFAVLNTVAKYNQDMKWYLFNTIVLIGLSSFIYGQRSITSLPYHEDFNAEDYSDIVWVSKGAVHRWIDNGWSGGAACFTPCTTQGYCGLGQFVGFREIADFQQLNVRFLVYYGPMYHVSGDQNKLIILNRSIGGRPMIITRYIPQSDSARTYGACDNTVCWYEGQDYWPTGVEKLRIGPRDRQEEWISVEIEANSLVGTIKIFISTEDGVFDDVLYVEQTMDDTGTGGYWEMIDIIGGYMNNGSPVHPENYFLIDELVIDSVRIGPPVGFYKNQSYIGTYHKNHQILNIYPNPTDGLVIVEGIDEYTRIDVKNYLGQSQDIDIDFGTHATVDMSKLAKGIYLLSITNKKNRTIKPVVVQ
jgi:hypothetical protein